jgi:hypothetical protein
MVLFASCSGCIWAFDSTSSIFLSTALRRLVQISLVLSTLRNQRTMTEIGKLGKHVIKSLLDSRSRPLVTNWNPNWPRCQWRTPMCHWTMSSPERRIWMLHEYTVRKLLDWVMCDWTCLSSVTWLFTQSRTQSELSENHQWIAHGRLFGNKSNSLLLDE